MVAGHAQLDVGKLLTQFEDVELEEAGLVLADVDGAEAGLLLDAEAQHRAVDGVDNIHRVFIVHVEDDRAGQQRKLLEREFELAHRAVIFKVVIVDVQDDAHRAGQLQKRLVVLAGLNDDALAVAGLAVAADEGQLAADDCRGITTCQLQCGGDHGSRGGLAVGAGNADAVLVQAAHIAQQNAALHSGDAIRSGGVQLHVVLGNGGRVDHQVSADHVVRSMTQADLHAHLPLRADDAAVQHIAAGDIISLGSEDLDQRIHTAAAAADEVDLFYIIQQMHGIISNEHKQANLQ